MGRGERLDCSTHWVWSGASPSRSRPHPVGVVWSEREKLLYVADSYNHKVTPSLPLS